MTADVPFDMPNHALAVLILIVMSVAAACGDDPSTPTALEGTGATSTAPPRTVEPEPFDAAAEGTLVTWSETAGECQECGFSIEFDADGTAVYEGHRTRSAVEFDIDELRDRLDQLDPAALTEGSDDCGREVDGNAPVLELHRADGSVLEIDDCYTPIDRDHPLMVLVLTTMADARAA